MARAGENVIPPVKAGEGRFCGLEQQNASPSIGKERGGTASERPLRVYHDWGLYGHASTREARDLRAANRRFNEYLRSKGYQPAGGEAKDGDGVGELAQPDRPAVHRAVSAGGRKPR